MIVKEKVDGAGGVIVTAATAFCVDSTSISDPARCVELVAVIVTRVVLVTFGAVNTPVFEMFPALADQVSVGRELPLTCAVNCSCSIDATVAVPGESETVVAGMAAGVTAALGKAALHAVVIAIRKATPSNSDKTTKFGI
ncbi:MAG TPA: hypothetical protein VFL34_12740 [Candidatus Sulfotelmatobacter sp.]|nr:hypothetical protein [Candidatus Sulfotelmatobacter sp.]